MPLARALQNDEFEGGVMVSDLSNSELSVDHFMISTFENQFLFMLLEEEGAFLPILLGNLQKNEGKRDFQ